MTIDATQARRLLNLIDTHYGAQAVMLVVVNKSGDSFVLERADNQDSRAFLLRVAQRAVDDRTGVR